MGVEPTILAAKDRINGFEGHEDHRTPFASTSAIQVVTRTEISRAPRIGDKPEAIRLRLLRLPTARRFVFRPSQPL